jgi:sRNA-binding carbon storage regulator CsrA
MEKGDRVLVGSNIIIDMRRTGSQCQISVEAPAEVSITPIYKDAKKQLKLGRGAHEG